MSITTIIPWLISHWKIASKVVFGLAVGILFVWNINLHNTNKKLSESLEMALNNIEAYLGSLLGSLLANNVLRLNIDDLQTYNDKLVHELDSVRKKLKIKPKHINVAATQTLIINVNDGKEFETGTISVHKEDSTYKDSIKFNDLTTVFYAITNDSISIGLDVHNTLYFYINKERHYKNKKNFFKRLFTLDFKKVNSYKYNIVNTNDLIKTDDVRVIEIVTK